MGLNDATLDLAADAIQDSITHVGLASGDPGPAGTNNATSAARQAVAWTAPSGGDFSNSADLNYTGGAASGAVQYATLWSAVTGGTFRGSKQLTGGSAFNALGEYRIPAGDLDIVGSSTT